MIAVLDIRNPDGTVRRRLWRRFSRNERRQAARWALDRLQGTIAAGEPVDRLLASVIPEAAARLVRDETGGPAFPKEV